MQEENSFNPNQSNITDQNQESLNQSDIGQTPQFPQTPLSPQSPEPPQPPSAQGSNKLLIIGFILVILALLAGAGYFYLQNQKLKSETSKLTPTPTQELPSPTPDPTANWKTYQNSPFGFELKYPPDWSSSIAPSEVKDFIIEFYKTGTRDASNTPPAGYAIEVNVENNPNKLTFKEWAQLDGESTCYTKPCTPDLTFSTEVTVAGIKTQIVSGQLPRWTQKAVYIPYKEKVYIIRAVNKLSDEVIVESLNKVFNQILSTFKFIDGEDELESVSCNTESDCIKYISCDEKCVNKEWAKDNPASVAPGAACVVEWEYGCKCVQNKCMVGEKL